MKTHFFKLFLFLSYTFFINTNVNARSYFQVNDTIQKTDSLKPQNNTLLGKILYEATDTTSISPKEKLIRLYNNAKITYQDMEITSGIIIVDYDKNEIYAGRIKDSLGEYTQLPVFKQGQDEIRPDSLKFNMDTEKAIIFNSRTEEAGLNILSDKTKK